jgi:hypothetical protein
VDSVAVVQHFLWILILLFCNPTNCDILPQVALLTMERDGLKAIVESYDHEEAPVSSQQQQQQQPGSPNTPQKKMRDMRIKVMIRIVLVTLRCILIDVHGDVT